MATGDALHGWAAYLAAMGWHVFPLRPGTKAPTGHREADCPGTGRCAAGHVTPEQRATTDADLIRAAWESRTAWNIGIATGPSGLVVIDLDMAKGGDTNPDGATGLVSLAAERGGPLPGTYTVDTPSGGRHLYYAAPPGVRLRNTKGQIAPNVDTRAWGGYVVGPGSVLPEGGYELVDDREPAELPAWLVQAVLARPTTPAAPARAVAKPDAYAAAALRAECDRIRTAPPTQHNNVLSTAAWKVGQLVGGGLLSHAAAEHALTAAGHTLVGSARDCRCTPAEVARVVAAGLAAGTRHPRSRRGSEAA